MNLLKKVFIFILFMVSSISTMFAGLPNDYESYCLEVMFTVENAIKASLPEEYEVVKIHDNFIGEIELGQYFARDCVIREKKEYGRAIAYLFTYKTENTTLSKIKEYQLISGLKAPGGEKINIAIMTKNAELKKNIQNVLKPINFKDIKPKRLEDYESAE